MSAQQSLEAQIRNDFNNWELWLVYADWLLEQGDARGEIIILEHKLWSIKNSSSENHAFRDRVRVLTETHKQQWLSGYEVLNKVNYGLRYGFVVSVSSKKGKILEQLTELFTHPTGRFLKELCFWKDSIGDKEIRRLASSEYLSRITELDLGGNQIKSESVYALIESEHLSSLKVLRLDNNSIESIGTRALAESKHFRSLIGLELDNNSIGDEGAIALAESENLRMLEALNLSGNKIGDEGAIALAESEYLSSLIGLDLDGNNIGAKGIRALIQSEKFHSLERLYLSKNNISPEELSVLKESSHLKNCVIQYT